MYTTNYSHYGDSFAMPTCPMQGCKGPDPIPESMGAREKITHDKGSTPFTHTFTPIRNLAAHIHLSMYSNCEGKPIARERTCKLHRCVRHL